MGLNYNDVRCLMEWRRDASGGRVATLGRLNLTLHPQDLRCLRRKFAHDARALAWLARYRWNQFADEMFLDALKFDNVTSIDFSDYEGATVIQDIGASLRADLAGQFDLAVDGGTLEHVFNFPVAVGNLMRLVTVGGAVYTQNPCNSLAGHGFYQFSPELMYRVFSEQNGFEILFVRISMARNQSVELTTNQPVYDVVDPAKYGGRVLLACPGPAILMSLAVKRSNVAPFGSPVLQSDYVQKWSSPTAIARLTWKNRLFGKVKRKFTFLPAMVSRYRDRKEASIRNTRAYRRLW